MSVPTLILFVAMFCIPVFGLGLVLDMSSCPSTDTQLPPLK